ncbi:MAG TPA: hypothetical protein VG941_01855 [Candidatus Paceibacterota bacterium]|nr:hypothetical protein [Candidatus Paceibacterota bacterium]
MNMMKKASIVLFTALTVISAAPSADASLFDWISNLKGSGAKTPDATAAWSFDTLYQNIQGISLDQTMADVSAVTATAVNSDSKSSSKTQSRTMIVEATGYSSTPDQTDDSPFITAKGTYVRDGIIAANFLPFGTVVKIPDVFGDKIFVVEDRMNKRYTNRIDVWFSDTPSALKFGLKTVKIEILS